MFSVVMLLSVYPSEIMVITTMLSYFTLNSNMLFKPFLNMKSTSQFVFHFSGRGKKKLWLIFSIYWSFFSLGGILFFKTKKSPHQITQCKRIKRKDRKNVSRATTTANYFGFEWVGRFPTSTHTWKCAKLPEPTIFHCAWGCCSPGVPTQLSKMPQLQEVQA